MLIFDVDFWKLGCLANNKYKEERESLAERNTSDTQPVFCCSKHVTVFNLFPDYIKHKNVCVVFVIPSCFCLSEDYLSSHLTARLNSTISKA